MWVHTAENSLFNVATGMVAEFYPSIPERPAPVLFVYFLGESHNAQQFRGKLARELWDRLIGGARPMGEGGEEMGSEHENRV
jgi:hypothetical protein